MKTSPEVVAGYQPPLYEEIRPTKPVLKLKELPYEMQPEPRLRYCGATALTTAELIGLIIQTGSKQENAIEVGMQLLSSFGGVAGIAQASVEQLLAIPGITETKAVQIKAAIEIGKRVLAASMGERPQVRNPTDVCNLLMLEMGLLEREELRVVLLDTKNFILRITTVYSGNTNSAVVRIKEVFTEAIRINAASVIIVHNHPSGDPSPSPEDVRVQEMISEAGKLLDIEVLDHLIIGRNRFFSMKERGLGFK